MENKLNGINYIVNWPRLKSDPHLTAEVPGSIMGKFVYGGHYNENAMMVDGCYYPNFLCYTRICCV